MFVMLLVIIFNWFFNICCCDKVISCVFFIGLDFLCFLIGVLVFLDVGVC